MNTIALAKVAAEKEDDELCECQNCNWRGPMSSLGCQLWEVDDLFERIAPGEIVPAGECPKCGCLASVIQPQVTVQVEKAKYLEWTAARIAKMSSGAKP